MSIFANPADGSVEAAESYVSAILDLLGDRDPGEVLRSTPLALERVVAATPPGDMTRPEAKGRWSVTHVLAHLCDSEHVWAVRLRRVLAEDEPLLEGYDQDLWAERLGYEAVDPVEAVDEFRAVRQANLRLLDRIPEASLERTGRHAERGSESARHMVRLYAGHDLVHLAQIRRILGGVAGVNPNRAAVRSADSVDAVVVGAGRDTLRRDLIDSGQGPHFSLRKFTMQPGGGMPRHTNTVEHEQYVLRGRGRIGIGDEVFDVETDDVVFIPAGVPHWYEAVGDGPFEFLCAVPNRPDRIDIVEG